MSDATHPNHIKKIVQPIKWHNLPRGVAPFQFLRIFKKHLVKLEQQIRPGPKFRRIGFDYMFRTPFGANLDKEERERFEYGIMSGLVGSNGIAVTAWHIDRTDGSADLHLLLFAVDFFGRLIPNRDHLPRVRAISDALHNTINTERAKIGMPLLETMAEVTKRQAIEPREKTGETYDETLAEELASFHKQSLEPYELRLAIEALGYEVNRFNPAKDYLSVRFKKGKRKTFRYEISSLIEDIETALSIEPSQDQGNEMSP